MSVRICGLLKYNCLKCSSEVLLEVHSNMQESTIQLWEQLFDSKLCVKCHQPVKNKTLYLN